MIAFSLWFNYQTVYQNFFYVHCSDHVGAYFGKVNYCTVSTYVRPLYKKKYNN